MSKDQLIQDGWETRNNLDFFKDELTLSFFKNGWQIWSSELQQVIQKGNEPGND